MTRKRVSLALLAAALSITGCSGGSSSSPAPEPAASQAQPSSTAAQPSAGYSASPAPSVSVVTASANSSDTAEPPVLAGATAALPDAGGGSEQPIATGTTETESISSPGAAFDPPAAPANPAPEDTSSAQPAPQPVSDNQGIVLADGPALPVDSDLGVLANALRTTGVTLIADFNRTLASGATLDATQARCSASHQPELGRALLQFDCSDESLEAFDGVLVRHVALTDTDACNDGLQSGDPSTCKLASLNLEIPTEYVFGGTPPAGADGFAPERPQPIHGADVAFRETGVDQLVISNDTASARGDYQCQIELLSSLSSPSGTAFVDCEEEINRVAERLVELLDKPAN